MLITLIRIALALTTPHTAEQGHELAHNLCERAVYLGVADNVITESREAVAEVLCRYDEPNGIVVTSWVGEISEIDGYNAHP